MHRDPMNAMSDFRVRIRQFELRFEAAIDRLPGLAAVVRAKSACGRNGDEYPVGVLRVEKDRMHRHAARAGLPEMAFGAAQPGKLLPRFAAVCGLENRAVFRPRIDCVRIRQRRLKMPDALEFPRMLRAVVPLVSAHLALINELVALAFGHFAWS